MYGSIPSFFSWCFRNASVISFLSLFHDDGICLLEEGGGISGNAGAASRSFGWQSDDGNELMNDREMNDNGLFRYLCFGSSFVMCAGM